PVGSDRSAELESNVDGSPSTSTHVIVCLSLLLLGDGAPDASRVGPQLGEPLMHDSSEFAAIVMSPCVTTLKRGNGPRGRSAEAPGTTARSTTEPSSTRRTPTTPQRAPTGMLIRPRSIRRPTTHLEAR